MAGVLTILLIDFNGLIKSLPIPPGQDIPDFTPGFKLLALIQPSLILSVMVLLGTALASKVGLSSPAAEALAGGGELIPALKPQFIPGIIGGLAGGTAIVCAALVSKLYLPPEVITRIAGLGNLLPFPTRLFYGGITEELLLRWGFMTLLVWAAWRLFQKGNGKPKPAYITGSIIVSSLVFGIGHLPVAFMIVPEASFALIMFVIIANSIFGLIAGYLYWKKGLESAMIAHAMAHVVLLAGSYIGMYF